MEEIPFDGRVSLRRVADLNLLEHHATVDQLHWNDRHIAEICTPYCYIIVQLSEGRLSVTQRAKEAVLGTGDWALVDSLRPAQFRFEGPMHILALNLPRELVAARSQGRDIPCATRLSGSTGAGAIFSSFARSLYVHAPSLQADDFRYRENVLDLLFASLPDTFDAQDRIRERHLQRAMRFIDRNLESPELSPQTIAAEIGVSARHLHRLFEETGKTISEWVLQRRLQRARSDLADLRLRGNSILGIAMSWGFKDNPHFSRAFKAAFEVSPRDYRRDALAARASRLSAD